MEKPYGHSNPVWIVLFFGLHTTVTWIIVELAPSFFDDAIHVGMYFLFLLAVMAIISRKHLDTAVYFDNSSAEPDLEAFVKYVDEKYYVPFEVALRDLPGYFRKVLRRVAYSESRDPSRLVDAQTQSRLLGAGILLFVLWLLLMLIDVAWASIWLAEGGGLDRLLVDPVLWFKNGAVVCALAVYLYGSGGLVRLCEALWEARDPGSQEAKTRKDRQPSSMYREMKTSRVKDDIKFIEMYEGYLKGAYDWKRHVYVGYVVLILVVVSMQVTHWYGIEAKILLSFPTMLFGFLLGYLISLYYSIARIINKIWKLPRSRSVRALYQFSRIGQRAQKFCLMMLVLVVFYVQTALSGLIGVTTDPALDQSLLFSVTTLIWIIFGIIFTLFFTASVSYGMYRRVELWKDREKAKLYLSFERTVDLQEVGRDTIEELRSSVDLINEITSWPGTLKSFLYAIAVIVVSTLLQILAWFVASVRT